MTCNTTKSAASLDRPLYMRIVRVLSQEIHSGGMPVGSRLQPETVLSESFNVSRHTIREALRHLRSEGLIRSRQGSGWVVAATGNSRRYVHAISSLVDLFQYAQETKLRVDSCDIVVATGKLAMRLSCSPGREWLRIEAARFAALDRDPICWVVVYVSNAYKDIAGSLSTHSGPLFNLIEERFQVEVSEIQQTIRARRIPERGAAALGIDVKASVFEIERVFRSSDRKVIEISFSYYPAEEFSYSVTLKRELRPEPVKASRSKAAA
jgi:GntR family transcriptional regulator